MADYDLEIEFAFGEDPLSDPAGWTWVDVTADRQGQSVTLTRGRQDESGSASPTQASFVLDNLDGQYTPGFASSPYYPNVVMGTPARLTVNSTVVFVGHVTSWQPSWPFGDLSDSTRPGEAQVVVEVSGIMQMLSRQPALRSALYRNSFHPDAAGLPAAYWPLEENENATEGYQAIGAGSAMRPYVNNQVFIDAEKSSVSWGSDEHPPGSVGAVSIGGGWGITGDTGAPTSAFWTWEAQVHFGGQVFIRWDTPASGSRDYYSLIIRDTGYVFGGVDTDSGTTTSVFGDLSTLTYVSWPNGVTLVGSHHIAITIAPAGIVLYLDGVSVNTAALFLVLNNIKRVQAVVTANSISLSHVTVWTEALSSTEIQSRYIASLGHAGEAAGERMQRLCDEEDIPLTVSGDAAETTLMGAQLGKNFLELLQECADADMGILYESRAAFGLKYRTRESLYNQDPALVLDADGPEGGDITHPFVPTHDDQKLWTSVQVSRENGGTLLVADEDAQARHGMYEESRSLNLESDTQLPYAASWILHLGTLLDMRYPSIAPALDVNPDLVDDWIGLDIGDRVQVINLPPQHPTDVVDLIIQGTSDSISPYLWGAEANATPASQWNVFVMDESRVEGDGSTTTAAIDDDDTSIPVTTPVGPIWGTADLPFDIVMNGEQITVTAISGAGPGQTFTVTRSVNDIVKSHASGSSFRLAPHESPVIAL